MNGGQFEFTMDGVAGFADLIVSVGGVEFGARVNALDTLRMDFVVNEPGKDVEVTYDGTTEKESRIWKDFYETYHRWSSYNLPKTNPEMTYDDCIALLDKNDAKFRGDDRICFISLSVDSDRDRDKWVEFVGKEKPFWPQFRLSETNQADFCDKVGINTIPRFLLIGCDGKFIDGDCARPSDGNIENILNKAISGR